MRYPRGFVATACFLIAVASPGDVHGQSVMAWSYTQKITIDSANGHIPSSLSSRVQVTDRFVRRQTLEFGSLKVPADRLKGSYLLFDGTDGTGTSVMPSQRAASVVTVGSAFAESRSLQMAYQPGMQRTLDDLGAGEPLIGHATEHYRLTEQGSMDVTLLGKTCTRRIDAVTELWIAPDVDIHPAFEAAAKVYGFADALPGMVATPPGAQLSMPKGTALRSIVRTTNTDSSGTDHVVTLTAEYLEISHSLVDDSLFAVPAGYRILDLRTAAPRSTSTDSSTKARGLQILNRMCENPG